MPRLMLQSKIRGTEAKCLPLLAQLYVAQAWAEMYHDSVGHE